MKENETASSLISQKIIFHLKKHKTEASF